MVELFDVGSTDRLLKRGSTFYYRRRVPRGKEAEFGTMVQFSLKTTNPTEAKRRRALADVEWDAKFAASPIILEKSGTRVMRSLGSLQDLVAGYVRENLELTRQRLISDPPGTEEEIVEAQADAGQILQMLTSPNDPRADEMVSAEASKILAQANAEIDETVVSYAHYASLVERTLIEVQRLRARLLVHDNSTTHIDALFDPKARPSGTFGELAADFLIFRREEAAHRGQALRSQDKLGATVRSVVEIIGAETRSDAVDHDVCQKFRVTVARLPKNRVKLLGGVPISRAIELADEKGLPRLAHLTQRDYIDALRGF